MSEKITCCGDPQPPVSTCNRTHDQNGEHSHDHHNHGSHHRHGHSCKQDHAHDAGHAHEHHAGQSASKQSGSMPPGTQQFRLHIAAMDCPTEEALIRRVLTPLPQVLGLDFDLLNRILTVHHKEQEVAEIQQKLAAIGMQGQLLAGTATAANAKQQGWWRLLAGGSAALAAEALVWAGSPEKALPVLILSLAAVLICGLPTLKKGWIALRHLTLNIHLLMTAAVSGALLIGQWPEAAMVICLFALAEMLEAASLIRARDAIGSLLDQAPETVQCQQLDGSWQAQNTAEIAVGALILCRPGDRIALDGVIESGQSEVNQAAITGESMPQEKIPGDPVYAGTLNQTGALQIRVSALAGASMLARIAHSVQDAQSQRAPTQRFVDRFAALYTPIVFAIAVLAAILPPLLWQHGWHDSLYRALVLLVIACPCALVISTPVTVVSGLALAARRGIVVKGGLFLEQGKLLQQLAFDKTGTLTEGKPALQHTQSFSALTPAEILRIAASLDAHSSHPLAQALLQACREPLLPVTEVSLFTEGRGRGIRGRIGNQPYLLGNRAMLAALGLEQMPDNGESAKSTNPPAAQSLEQDGSTLIFLCQPGQLLGVLGVADQVRASSREAVQELHALGIRTLMLTGDNASAAQAIAKQTEIEEVRSELLPEDKLQVISTLAQQGMTGMAGDGINDAPALARAQIGFAMAAGSDIALETADVALMQNDLRKLPEFIRISRKTNAVLWQNIAFALAIKLLFLLLALTGHASLWMAVFADTGTSLLVVLNGLRLLRYSSSGV